MARKPPRRSREVLSVTLNVQQIRQLARDAVTLAAAVKLYVPPAQTGLHHIAAKRVLRQLTRPYAVGPA